MFKNEIQVIDDYIYETDEEDSIDESAFGSDNSSDLEDPFKTDEEDSIILHGNGESEVVIVVV